MIIGFALAHCACTTGGAGCRDSIGNRCTVGCAVAVGFGTRCVRIRVTSCFAGIEMIIVFAFAHGACTAGGAGRRHCIGNSCTIGGTVAVGFGARCVRIFIASGFPGIEMIIGRAFAHRAGTAGA